MTFWLKRSKRTETPGAERQDLERRYTSGRRRIIWFNAQAQADVAPAHVWIGSQVEDPEER